MVTPDAPALLPQLNALASVRADELFTFWPKLKGADVAPKTGKLTLGADAAGAGSVAEDDGVAEELPRNENIPCDALKPELMPSPKGAAPLRTSCCCG